MIKLLVASVFLVIINAFPQSHRIREVIDNNLFMLDKGETVEIADLLIPLRNDTTFGNLSQEIYDWADDEFFNEVYKIEFTKSMSQAWFFDRKNGSDLRIKYLTKGYGLFLGEGVQDNMALIDAEELAKNNKKGIWAFPDSTRELFISNNKEYLDNSELIREEKKLTQQENLLNPNVKVTRPYLGLIALSGLCAYLAYDFLSEASDISEGINALKQVFGSSIDTSELESKKSSKTLGGILSIAAGVVIAGIALQTVEVYTGPNSLIVSYRF